MKVKLTENTIKLIDKLLSVVVDRRFWLQFIFPVCLAFGIFPYIAESNQEVMADQAVEWATLVVQVVVPLLSTLFLGYSWTQRAPSGLNFTETETKVPVKQASIEDFVEELKTLVEDKS